MSLEELLRAVLESHESGKPLDSAVVDGIKAELAGECESWAVSNEESEEPDQILHGTASEHLAWHEGFDYAAGWLEPTTFSVEQDALDHIAENNQEVV